MVDTLLQEGLALLRVRIEFLPCQITLGQALGVTTEDDVHASTGHVGGHGHPAEPTGLCHHLGLTGVLLGVEHLVSDAPLFKFS